MRQDPGLAGAGAGQDQQRALAVGNGLTLGLVEAFQALLEMGAAWGSPASLPRIDAEPAAARRRQGAVGRRLSRRRDWARERSSRGRTSASGWGSAVALLRQHNRSSVTIRPRGPGWPRRSDGQVDPVGVGTLGAATFNADRVARVADDRRVRGNVGDDDAVGADLRAVADGDRAQQLGSEPMVTLSWTVGWRLPVAKPVPPRVSPGRASRRSRSRPFRRPRPGAVVDEQAGADLRGRVDLDAGQRAGPARSRGSTGTPAREQRVREAVGEQRMEPGPGSEDLQQTRHRGPQGRDPWLRVRPGGPRWPPPRTLQSGHPHSVAAPAGRDLPGPAWAPAKKACEM